jgi:DHA2 family multidrug resistance protein
MLGRKRYFLICITVFTTCSLLCGVSNELWELIVFRVLQGFFGGGLQPVQQSVLLDYFKPEQRGRANGLSMVAIIVAPVLGPTLGGWITDNFSWRWIFFINVPVGILTTLAVFHLLEDPPWERKAPKGTLSVDYIGIGLIAIGLGCLQVVMDRGEDADWFGSPFICTFAVLAAIGLTSAVYWLIYATKPVVDVRVFKDRNFAVACLLMGAMALVLYASSVLVPQLAQQQLGYTATLAGLVLSPGAVFIVLSIPLVLWLMPIVPTRYLIAAGFAMMGLGYAYSTGLVPSLDFSTLVWMRSAQSVGLGFLFVPLTTIAFISLPQKLSADASGLFTMFRNVAGSIGISLATAGITERSQVQRAHLVPNLTPFNEPYNQLSQVWVSAIHNFSLAVGNPTSLAGGKIEKMLENQSAILAYSDLFAACAALSFLMIPFCFLLSSAKRSGSAGAH